MPDSNAGVAAAPALDRTQAVSIPDEASLPADHTLVSSSDNPAPETDRTHAKPSQPRAPALDHTLGEPNPGASSGEIDLQGTSQTIDLSPVHEK
jgi:hypothetical protein